MVLISDTGRDSLSFVGYSLCWVLQIGFHQRITGLAMTYQLPSNKNNTFYGKSIIYQGQMLFFQWKACVKQETCYFLQHKQHLLQEHVFFVRELQETIEQSLGKTTAVLILAFLGKGQRPCSSLFGKSYLGPHWFQTWPRTAQSFPRAWYAWCKMSFQASRFVRFSISEHVLLFQPDLETSLESCLKQPFFNC